MYEKKFKQRDNCCVFLSGAICGDGNLQSAIRGRIIAGANKENRRAETI